MPAVGMKMMFGKPYRMKAISIRFIGFYEHILIELLLAPVKLRKKARQVKKRKFHGHSLLCCPFELT
jgi:hypothetical protein